MEHTVGILKSRGTGWVNGNNGINPQFLIIYIFPSSRKHLDNQMHMDSQCYHFQYNNNNYYYNNNYTLSLAPNLDNSDWLYNKVNDCKWSVVNHMTWTDAFGSQN